MNKIFVFGFSLLALTPLTANAHGVAGNRVFPATLEIEDPAVEDEISLPKIHSFKEREDDGEAKRDVETSVEYSKRITNNFGLSAEGAYVAANGQPNGFDNFGVSAKYQFYQNAPHEVLVSAGLDWDIGHTGSDLIGAEHFHTLTPQIFFGKGFGDLPDGAEYLKPFALTGQIGVGVPTDIEFDGEKNATTLQYGFSLQYSIPYLQQHIKDVGIPAPFNNVIPIVEVNFSTPIAHNNNSNVTTGTINPGVIWMGETTQVGLEAVLPANHNSGHGVGVLTELHFYLDDVFPTTIGKPLFE